MLCYRSTAGLSLLRPLGRPAILTLRDASGRAVYAQLVGLGEQRATLRLGERMLTVTLAALAGAWRGEFATFWRAPPGYAGRIVDGASGPAVDWVAARLAALDGRPAPPGGRSADAALRTRLHAFQLAQGLKPDGTAGPTTLMLLNRASGIDEPRLAAS